LLHRRARVEHVLAALPERESDQHPEDGALAQRDHRCLRRLRGAADRLHHRLVRGKVEARHARGVGGQVRALGIFLEHPRPWMVNSSFTLSFSAAVRFDSISGLSMVTVFPPSFPSPTTSLRKLAGEVLLRPPSARLVAANRILFPPGCR